MIGRLGSEKMMDECDEFGLCIDVYCVVFGVIDLAKNEEADVAWLNKCI